jgi:glycerol-3-phosphate dehydrogenase
LAEEVTAKILNRLNRPVIATSEERLLPGAEDYPHSAADLKHRCQGIADRLGYTPAQIRAAWELHGARTETALTAHPASGVLAGVDLPLALARYAIRAEWARTLDDLVERRLMLLYHHRLGEETLRQLAQILVEEGTISPDQAAAQVQACVSRLQTHFGKQVRTNS